MFGLISARKLKKELERIKHENNMQEVKKTSKMNPAYLQGYEDASDNCCNYLLKKYCN